MNSTIYSPPSPLCLPQLSCQVTSISISPTPATLPDSSLSFTPSTSVSLHPLLPTKLAVKWTSPSPGPASPPPSLSPPWTSLITISSPFLFLSPLSLLLLPPLSPLAVTSALSPPLTLPPLLSHLLPIDSFSQLSVDSATSTLFSSLTSSLDSLCPLISRPARPSPPQPWLSSALRSARITLRSAEKKWKRTKLPAALDLYRTLLSSFSSTLSSAKCTYFQSVIQASTNNPRKLLSTFSSLLNPPPLLLPHLSPLMTLPPSSLLKSQMSANSLTPLPPPHTLLLEPLHPLHLILTHPPSPPSRPSQTLTSPPCSRVTNPPRVPWTPSPLTSFKLLLLLYFPSSPPFSTPLSFLVSFPLPSKKPLSLPSSKNLPLTPPPSRATVLSPS
ncbi:proline-rich protein 36-like isoform X1 [Acipenser ruthenus]|uniref:proline-rich protein 36-like isoform X1 n=1 Tax=Acipenser ruthenus TaxID=7906 RepID=UPI00274284A9|nr:proline-rich protein 36-like isoform X1 [Acipenser ruthenus]